MNAVYLGMVVFLYGLPVDLVYICTMALPGCYSSPPFCTQARRNWSLNLFQRLWECANTLHRMFCFCRALHGDIAQSAREATLAGFRSGRFNVLVATDVAARGLDINGIELVIQVCGVYS